MSLDTRFIETSDIQNYFADKDTGAPLAGGIVKFFKDAARSQGKDVYELSGSPTYTYTTLGNTLTLSGTGTWQDNQQNSIVPFYYPFTLTPNDNTGVQELYYIEVYNSNNVLQFTRQAWPSNVDDVSIDSTTDITNFIPNGQFLTHTDLPADILNDISLGEVTQSSTILAQGGWTFELPVSFVGNYSILFQELGTVIAGLPDFPRWAVNLICTNAGSPPNEISDLMIKFFDVNKFASSGGISRVYTLYFNGESTDSIDHIVGLYLIRNYGTGSPTAQSEQFLTNFTIGTNFGSQLYSFTMPQPASSFTLGVNQDDFVALVFRMPQTSYNLILTDFVFANGNIALTSFPNETNSQMLSESFAGFLRPAKSDGSDLYLPIIMAQQGFEYDATQIGFIYPNSGPNNPPNYLFCDGSQYLTNGYSSLGIPYARLFNVLFDNILNLPIYGTGVDFVTTSIEAAGSALIFISTNKFGTATVPADGTNPTGFTFAIHHAANSTSYNVWARCSNSTISIRAIYFRSGGITGATDINSGFTIINHVNNNITWQYFTAGAVSASSLANPSGNGKYWEFTSADNLGNLTLYYVWYQITNERDPAPLGGVGIKILLNASNTAGDVANITAYALTGGYQYIVDVTNASSVPANSWFSFGVPNGNSYYVWYNKGGGTDPAPAGYTLGIQVDISSNPNAAMLALLTNKSINSTYFAVPDLRGMSLRGLDSGNPSNWDFDVASRFGYIYPYFGTNVGTFEFDSYASHLHPLLTSNFTGTATAAANSGSANVGTATGTTTNYAGTAETRGVNMSVNWVIKY
jgi:hypothetical protein